MSLAEKPGQPRMTAAQFLDWEGDGHPGKQELVGGRIRSMAPPSSFHGMLQLRLGSLVDQQLRKNKRVCRGGTEVGVIPKWDPGHNVRVPDLTVTRTPLTPREKTFPNPILIIQIMSPSNESDTWESIQACATIPSLTEIVVVESEPVKISIFRKGANGAWPEDPEVVEPGGTVRIATIEAVFPIDVLYEDAAFT